MKADAEKVSRLLKTARGQLDGILRMVEQEKYGMDISHQILACEAILKKTNREILRCHIESCVQDAFEDGDPDQKQAKINELTDLIERMR